MATFRQRDTLSFELCEIGGSLKGIWYSLDGNSLSTMADALEEFRAEYGADVIKVGTNRFTSKMSRTGETIHNTWITFALSSPDMVANGWTLLLSMSASDRYPVLDIQVLYDSSCD